MYFANWGTHRLMLRGPVKRVDPKALRAYFVALGSELLLNHREFNRLWVARARNSTFLTRKSRGCWVPFTAAITVGWR